MFLLASPGDGAAGTRLQWGLEPDLLADCLGECINSPVVFQQDGLNPRKSFLDLGKAICGQALPFGALGNVRTQTLRAFSAEEMGKILGKLA